MTPEEIQEQIDILGQRASVRVSHLQLNDPQLQNIVGQIEAYKSILEAKVESVDIKGNSSKNKIVSKTL